MTEPWTEKRATRRRLIGLQAECRVGAKVATGIVRDLTTSGAFVASSLDPASGGVQRTTEMALEQLLQVGDQLVLVYLATSFMRERSMSATVRWRGLSTEHNCHGCGVEFAAG